MTGTFLSDGLARSISLPPGYDQIELVNITDLAVPDAGATTQVMRARGYSSAPAGCAYVTAKTANQIYTALETVTATNGFTFVADSGNQTPGAPVVVTAITAASPAVISTKRSSSLFPKLST